MFLVKLHGTAEAVKLRREGEAEMRRGRSCFIFLLLAVRCPEVAFALDGLFCEHFQHY